MILISSQTGAKYTVWSTDLSNRSNRSLLLVNVEEDFKYSIKYIIFM